MQGDYHSQELVLLVSNHGTVSVTEALLNLSIIIIHIIKKILLTAFETYFTFP
jgi:hypothetical protein